MNPPTIPEPPANDKFPLTVAIIGVFFAGCFVAGYITQMVYGTPWYPR